MIQRQAKTSKKTRAELAREKVFLLVFIWRISASQEMRAFPGLCSVLNKIVIKNLGGICLINYLLR